MAEWSNAAVLKTAKAQVFRGSNPLLSSLSLVIFEKIRRHCEISMIFVILDNGNRLDRDAEER